MNNYNWSREKLQSIKSKLQLQAQLNDITRRDLRTLSIMLGDEIERSDVFLNDDFKFMIEIKTLAEDYYSKSLIKGIQFDYIPSLSLGIDDYLKLVYEFFKTCCPVYFEYFLKEYSRRNTNLEITYGFQSNAITYHLLSLKESFIHAYLNNTIMDLANLPHEYGHVATFLKNSSFVKNPKSLYVREIDGYTFQLRFLNYLIKNDLFREDAILAKVFVDSSMCRRARSILLDSAKLNDVIIFYAYLSSIELSLYDNQLSDTILDNIITGDLQTEKDGLDIVSSQIIVGENTGSFQKQLKKQFSQC